MAFQRTFLFGAVFSMLVSACGGGGSDDASGLEPIASKTEVADSLPAESGTSNSGKDVSVLPVLVGTPPAASALQWSNVSVVGTELIPGNTLGFVDGPVVQSDDAGNRLIYWRSSQDFDPRSATYTKVKTSMSRGFAGSDQWEAVNLASLDDGKNVDVWSIDVDPRTGNGYALWIGVDGLQLSHYTPALGWSVAYPVGKGVIGNLAVNADGSATVVSFDETINARRFDPTSGFGPTRSTVTGDGASGYGPAIVSSAIDGKSSLVAWRQWYVEPSIGTMSSALFSGVYNSDAGWSAPALLGISDVQRPNDEFAGLSYVPGSDVGSIVMALNSRTLGGVLFGFDTLAGGAAAGMWSTPRNIDFTIQNQDSVEGTHVVSHRDGSMLAAWSQTRYLTDLDVTGRRFFRTVMVNRFDPVTGWGVPFEVEGADSVDKIVDGATVQFNSNGDWVVLWAETVNGTVSLHVREHLITGGWQQDEAVATFAPAAGRRVGVTSLAYRADRGVAIAWEEVESGVFGETYTFNFVERQGSRLNSANTLESDRAERIGAALSFCGHSSGEMVSTNPVSIPSMVFWLRFFQYSAIPASPFLLAHSSRVGRSPMYCMNGMLKPHEV